jgi:hypothetical protein
VQDGKDAAVGLADPDVTLATTVFAVCVDKDVSAMLLSVFDDPEIVLLVSVSVEVRATSVSVAAGRVSTVPVPATAFGLTCAVPLVEPYIVTDPATGPVVWPNVMSPFEIVAFALPTTVVPVDAYQVICPPVLLVTVPPPPPVVQTPPASTVLPLASNCTQCPLVAVPVESCNLPPVPWFVVVPPSAIDCPPMVIDELVSELLPMLDSVFDDPEMVLFVNVSVVARATSVSVAAGIVRTLDPKAPVVGCKVIAPDVALLKAIVPTTEPATPKLGVAVLPNVPALL